MKTQLMTQRNIDESIQRKTNDKIKMIKMLKFEEPYVEDKSQGSVGILSSEVYIENDLKF